jgi:hypothetical protein
MTALSRVPQPSMRIYDLRLLSPWRASFPHITALTPQNVENFKGLQCLENELRGLLFV